VRGLAALLVLPLCALGCGLRDDRDRARPVPQGEVGRIYEAELGRAAESRLLNLFRKAPCRIQVEGMRRDPLTKDPPAYLGSAVVESDEGPIAIDVAGGVASIRVIPKDVWAKARQGLVARARRLGGRVLKVKTACDPSWWFLRMECDGASSGAAFWGVWGPAEGEAGEAWREWEIITSYARGRWDVPPPDREVPLPE